MRIPGTRPIAGWGAACALLAALLAAGCGDPGPERPNVVVVVLDTLRRDATGLVSEATPGDLRDADLTPRLHALAAESVTFGAAWSVAPWTAPSHASLFTGLMPSRHGCTAQHPRLEAGPPTFAERLRGSGYATGAFYSNVWLANRTTRLLRGFVNRQESEVGGLGQLLSRRGDQGGAETLEALCAWLGRRDPEQPFLLFVNFLESHLSYNPPPEYRRRVLADLSVRDRIEIDWAHAFNAGAVEREGVDWSRVVRLYAGDCWFADRFLGGVLDRLEELGMREDTIVIVTSDHGENLGDHGLMDHQYSIAETLLAVPLVVHVPPRWRSRFDLHAGPGGRRDDPVVLTDLYDTVLALAGLTPDPETSHARSLFDDPAPADRPVFAEYAGPDPRLLDLLRGYNPEVDAAALAPARSTVRVGDFRLSADAAGDTVLHDVRRDPGQVRDVSAEHPEIVAVLVELLKEMTAGRIDSDTGDVEIDEATRRQLESLGYIH